MREKFPNQVERSRTQHPLYPRTSPHENNGLFRIWRKKDEFVVLISDGGGWDHVSVSLQKRCPDWSEMCWIKNLFFDKEEAVLQFHPPRSDYVNNCGTCLHLWRPQGGMELPDPLMVGFLSP